MSDEAEKKKFTRKDFLKMMGAAGVGIVATKFLVFDGLGGRRQEAEAQSGQAWGQTYLTNVIPIHAVLLPTGDVLAVAGSGYHTQTKDGPFLAQVLDPSTGRGTTFTMSEDLFCCGQNHLANGNILITGGQLQYDTDNPEGRFRGLNAVYIYNVYTNRFTKLANMRHGRWYPSQVVLPDGRVWIIDGLDEYGFRNALIEIFHPSTNGTVIQYRPDSSATYNVGAGSSLPGPKPSYGGPGQGVSPFTSLYPRAHLMPSGLIVIAGMSNTVYIVNPGPGTIAGRAEGSWLNAGSTIPSWRDYGTSFLLPLNNTSSERGRVLITGGASSWGATAERTSRIIDFQAGSNTAPVIRNVGQLATGRAFLNPVILPDGRPVVFGGVTRTTSDHVHTAEVFNTATETWSTLTGEARVSRSYHSAALLLPDGRVWISSGTPTRASWEHRAELYVPSYVNATRPLITGRVITSGYGGTYRIPTSSSVSRVSLVRLGAQTHHYDPNMRLLWLAVTGSYSGGVQVAAPLNSRLAPPGHYMIHVLNSSNIPSRAQIIRVGPA